MRFLELRYHNFRNIADGRVACGADNIVLEGVNGQGKTNLLESVYLLSYGSSFRTQNPKEMIRFGESRMRVSGIAETDDGERVQVDYMLEDGKRRIRLGGKDVRDRKEFIYNFPSIVFSHEDIGFVKGEAETRRRFFDQTFSMYDPEYLDDLRRYRAILNQRNAAIKQGQASLLELYDARLAKHGLAVSEKRRKGVEEFNEIFPGLYKEVSGLEDDIRIAYGPSWKDMRTTEEIEALLSARRDHDMRSGHTTSGVHRDKYVVTRNNVPFSQSGSTGQVRLASLLFRVAQARAYMAKTGKKPILLVDDVLLELDSAKRASFLLRLDGYSQAFFTFLPDERYFASPRESWLEYGVSDGKAVEKSK